MFKRILVPLDGSKRAEQALPLAIRLARASGGTLLLLRVDTSLQDLAWYSTEAAFMMPDALAAERAAIRRYMDRMAASEALAGIPHEAVIVEADAAQGILTAIDEQKADVIVIGTHGRTGLKRWVIGSVARKVARQSPVPVLVLRTSEETQPALPQGQPVRVMVPLDGSTLAEAALKPAVALSQALSAPGNGALHLVQILPIAAHVGVLPEEAAWVAVPGGGAQAGSALPIHVQEDVPTNPEARVAGRTQALNKAHTYLSKVRDTLRQEEGLAHDFQITTSAVIDIDIASAVMALAESGEMSGAHISDAVEECAMIAMATHGRSGPTRWVMGSVTERVLDTTSLPLLIVRPQKH
jgi:nucleotide-binding universal stress UspA family protein